MITNIFNFCIPREYTDFNGELKYALPTETENMAVMDLQTIQSFAKPGAAKASNPWCQIFCCNHRVTTSNIDWSKWNGFTQADVDSKLFYNNVKPFNIDDLLKAIHYNGQDKFPNNYFCVQKSSGGKGYSILFYWNCERTEINFHKCCLLTEQITKKIFEFSGAETIINYKFGNSKVLDNCSKSVYQGIYINANPLFVSNNINDENFGYVDIDSFEYAVQKTTEIIPLHGDFKQDEQVSFVNKSQIDLSNISYYDHHRRRDIYEALMILFKNKEDVDKEWILIANIIPEENGHSHKFYEEEPNKNKWFNKFDNKRYHSLDILRKLGYEYTDKTEYIYKEQFEKSWKSHVRAAVIEIIVQQNEKAIIEQLKSQGNQKIKKETLELQLKLFKEQLVEEASNYSIFDNYFDSKITEENKPKLSWCRENYYNKRFQKSDFKYLVNGYKIPDDIVTYKMFADFYYRDENNMPLLKYDILEDDIMTFGYWPETNKFHWHVFKFNEEYTSWKNQENFSTKMTKQDFQFAVEKYTKRWHNFHTIRKYLNNLDLSKANTELLETWAIRYFKAKDTKLTRTICKNFFIAAVKKQMIENPNTFTFQHMLCLQGPTGCGKTFFLVNMFTIDDKSYILNKIDPNGKDSDIGPLIAKNWLLQFGESENLTRVSVNAQKEFVDRMNLGLKFQAKYEKEQTTVYPRIVIARTTNEETYLNDVTINEGDRRNWIIKCECEAMCCDEDMKKIIREEKDILWTTALKLYLDNPNQDLELSIDEFKELADLQEEAKVIKKDDIADTYNEIFKRVYYCDNKSKIISERDFSLMVQRAEILITSGEQFFKDSLDGKNVYNLQDYINVIPSKWLSNYIKKTYSNNYLKVLKDYMLKNGWEIKRNIKYNTLCFCRINKKSIHELNNIFN